MRKGASNKKPNFLLIRFPHLDAYILCTGYYLGSTRQYLPNLPDLVRIQNNIWPKIRVSCLSDLIL